MGEGVDVREVRTHCRICEPQCGLVATVSGGRIVGIRENRDHVFSQGILCPKAAAAADLVDDPDRVLRPLRRVGRPGEFEPVSWDEALGDITARLAKIRAAHGAAAFATFLGNPPAFGYKTIFGLSGFQQALGVRWKYGVNGEDTAARAVASSLLYGKLSTPVPDFWRTHFAIVIGANPFVSHGSLFSEPKVREMLHAIVARGGRVVVVDPRRTETARAFEHVAVRPGTDAWFLLGMIRTLFDERLVDRAAVAELTSGAERLGELTRDFDVRECAERSGLDAELIRALARDFAAAPSGVVYGRTGTCQQRFGTLNNVLQDAVNALTGNVGRAGGFVPGSGAFDFEKILEAAGLDAYGANPTRVRGHPDVLGLHPSSSLVPDIRTPGEGQVRALMTIGANPAITVPAGPELEDALEELDLHFALDLYVNETNRHAHYVLPVTSFYERDDFPLLVMGTMLRPSIWWSPAVVPRRGEVREEWEILQEIARRMGVGGAYGVPLLRGLAKIGIEIGPERLFDLALRTGPVGDRFGLRRGGLNVKRLKRDHPNGVVLWNELPIGDLRSWLRTPDRRIALAPAVLEGELARLRAHRDDPAYPLRLIGMREMKSQNSWLHNSTRLVPEGRRQRALVNPSDAAAHGIADGDPIVIRSKAGRIELPARITSDVGPGTVAVPHGWGHAGGWRHANAAGGATSNHLASAAVEDIEPLAGMSILTGVPIAIEPAH